MNFFDVLNNVLYNKKNDNKILYDGIEEFSPFMINPGFQAEPDPPETGK